MIFGVEITHLMHHRTTYKCVCVCVWMGAVVHDAIANVILSYTVHSHRYETTIGHRMKKLNTLPQTLNMSCAIRSNVYYNISVIQIEI